jgi:dTDP-4-amino-4,6-dideoxygalactose transaminase
LGIKEGDEIITTPMTFCATSNAALYLGATVKFVDIDPHTLNIDPKKIEAQITDKTKVIMPVDFRGHPADLVAINKIAKKHGLFVVEDGSHSIGSTYKENGKSFSCGDGQHADFCTFSFHPVKHITTGEGGAVLTNNHELFAKVSALSKHGIDRREEMFSESDRRGNWYYEMEMLGFNYRMTDFQAALGISQLKKIDGYKARRRQIVELYNKELDRFDELIVPFESDSADSNFHIYTIQVALGKSFDRYDLYKYLISIGYRVMVHYIPVHLLDFYKKTFGYKEGDFPVAEAYYDKAISLPLYPSLSDTDVETVVKDIEKFILRSRKNQSEP